MLPGTLISSPNSPQKPSLAPRRAKAVASQNRHFRALPPGVQSRRRGECLAAVAVSSRLVDRPPLLAEEIADAYQHEHQQDTHPKPQPEHRSPLSTSATQLFATAIAASSITLAASSPPRILDDHNVSVAEWKRRHASSRDNQRDNRPRAWIWQSGIFREGTGSGYGPFYRR